MKTFSHLLWRELFDRRAIFGAALAIGFMPYALQHVATTNPAEFAEVRVTIARAIVLGLLLGMPLVLGARWLVAEFAGGRRGFELARPVSAWALCSSKLTANVVFIFGSAWLASLPTGMAALRIDRGVFETFLPREFGKDPDAAWRIYTLLTGATGGTDAGGPAFKELAMLAIVTVLVLFVFAQALAFAAVHPGWTSLADLGTFAVFTLQLGLAYFFFRVAEATGVWLSWLPWLGGAVAGLGVLAGWQSFKAGSVLGKAHRRHVLVFDLGLILLGYLTISAARAEVRPDLRRLETSSLAVPSAASGLPRHQNLLPYDLEPAAAEPRPFLPWRPR